jgi:methyl-accepting chemotaxis protein
MLAQLSIRAKLVAVVSLLLVSPAAIGVFGLLQMRSQNAHLMDIQTSWLPSVQTLGELRASTITYRVVVRDLVALTDPEARARTEKTRDRHPEHRQGPQGL